MKKEFVSQYEEAIFDLLQTPAGQKIIDQLMFEDYAAQLSPHQMTSEVLAYAEGRRSVVRDMLRIKRQIEQLQKESKGERETTGK